jgi:non-heme chloroperoxidase
MREGVLRRELLRTGALAAGAGLIAGCQGRAGAAGAVSPAASPAHAGAGSLAGAAGHGPVSAAAGPAKPGDGDAFIRTRDGASLFHLDWGSGPPVVFLHAWALCSDIWEYQLTALVERGLRCVAYDRRGHGRSHDPGRGYDFDTLAGDLAAVLDELDLRGVTLVAHSMGAGEVARYLARYGTGRIARVMLTSPITPAVARTADNPDGADRSLFEGIVAVLKKDRPGALTAGVGKFTGTRPVSPALTQWILSQFLRASPLAVIECMRSIGSSDFRPDLRAFTVPTWIVHGDADELNALDRTARRTAQAIPGSRLIVYPGAPHGLIVTDKERFTRDLLSFVSG